MREYVTAERTAVKIRLLSNVMPQQAFLLVEGATDARFYGKFVDRERCVIESGGGKDVVEGAVQILVRSGFTRAVGIIDADFAHLESRSVETENVFATDTHDIETLILQSPALEDVLAEYADQNRLAGFLQSSGNDLRNILLDAGSWLGALRWISLRVDGRLNFDGLNYAEFLQASTLMPDVERLIQAVMKNSKHANLPQLTNLLERAQAVVASGVDLWQLCCGHDLVRILLFGLHHIFGSYNARDLTAAELEGSLRIAYDQAHFASTQLYRSARAWERAHAPLKLFAKGRAPDIRRIQ